MILLALRRNFPAPLNCDFASSINETVLTNVVLEISFPATVPFNVYAIATYENRMPVASLSMKMRFVFILIGIDIDRDTAWKH